MDLSKWAYKLEPLVPSSLVLAALRHARSSRELDMASSPYDLRAWGCEPVRVETPAGRAEHARRQAALARDAAPLRTALLTVCERALRELPAGGAA